MISKVFVIVIVCILLKVVYTYLTLWNVLEKEKTKIHKTVLLVMHYCLKKNEKVVIEEKNK